MGEFDKIIKQNIEAIFLPLVERLLGIKISHAVALSEKIQTTIEREPDFLKKVIDQYQQEFILHLEFQSTDEAKMVYRMAEYKAILQRKYEMPVRQYVIYLGIKQPKMRTELMDDEAITGFQMKNIHNLPVNELLESEVPEEIILSILTDYPAADSELVIQKIIVSLQKTTNDEATLKRYIQQLLILSRLRKLDKKTENQINKMPITYDIENDYLFNKGIKEGMEQKTDQMILDMLEDRSLTLEMIAKFSRTSIKYVEQLRDSKSTF